MLEQITLLLAIALRVLGSESDYDLLNSQKYEIISEQSTTTVPAGEWIMSAVISERQMNDSKSLHWLLEMKRTRNVAGTFNELQDNMMLQTYI